MYDLTFGSDRVSAQVFLGWEIEFMIENGKEIVRVQPLAIPAPRPWAGTRYQLIDHEQAGAPG